jgi:phosphoglycerate kinase
VTKLARYLTLDDVKVKDKVVLVRVDFNSAIDPETKKILEDARIRAHAQATIKELADKGAKVVILAHQGRKGDPDFMPLKQHAEILGKILGRQVKYVDDLFGDKAKNAIRNLKSGEILVLENVRTYDAETKSGTPEEHAKTELVKNLAPLADLFVNDAFAAAHRAHVSMVGFTAVLPSVAGRIMEKELKSLSKVLENPEKPCAFIFGGAKADDSLEISKYVLEKRIADHILTGGVIGQVFLAAKGINLGKPNMDYLQKKQLTGLLPGIKELINKNPEKIRTPQDVAVEANGKRKEIPVKDLPTDLQMFDIGTRTIDDYGKIINTAKSIVISGPMGVYENPEFSAGTKKILEQIAKSKAFSLAGGGHTISAIEEFKLNDKISYISTAGGALIEFLMGKKLPGVTALENAATRTTKQKH